MALDVEGGLAAHDYAGEAVGANWSDVQTHAAD